MDHYYNTLSDAYCKLIYIFKEACESTYDACIKTRYKNEPKRGKEWLAKYRNKFDQLPVAEEAFRHFGLELLGGLSEAEQDVLRLVFAKRHELRGCRDLIEKGLPKADPPLAALVPQGAARQLVARQHLVLT